MSTNISVFTSENVLLYGLDEVKPATIIVDTSTGKITEVKESRASRQDFPDVADNQWFDVGKNLILPGLVECVDHFMTSSITHICVVHTSI